MSSYETEEKGATEIARAEYRGRRFILELEFRTWAMKGLSITLRISCSGVVNLRHAYPPSNTDRTFTDERSLLELRFRRRQRL